MGLDSRFYYPLRPTSAEDYSESLMNDAKALTLKAVNSISGSEQIRLLRAGKVRRW